MFVTKLLQNGLTDYDEIGLDLSRKPEKGIIFCK